MKALSAPLKAIARTSTTITHPAWPTPLFIAKLFPPPPSPSPTTPTTIPSPSLPPSYTLHLYPSTALSSSDFNACYTLIQSTSSGDYRASSAGWRPYSKKQEMGFLDLRYILLREKKEEKEEEEGGEKREELSEGEKVCGFMSFMLTIEDGVEVIYCYEIHLHESVRGQGIGKQLMGLLEAAGRKARVEKAMLTVFKRNVDAVGFYKGLGYEEDEYSPRPKKLRNRVVKEADYLIMWKSLIDGVEDHEEGRRRKRKAG